VSAQQAVVAPLLYRLRGDTEVVSDLRERQHAGLAQPVVPRLEFVVTSQSFDDDAVERFAFTGYETALVEDTRDITFCMLIEQGVDLGDDLG